jgi:hypothetical protein
VHEQRNLAAPIWFLFTDISYSVIDKETYQLYIDRKEVMELNTYLIVTHSSFKIFQVDYTQYIVSSHGTHDKYKIGIQSHSRY